MCHFPLKFYGMKLKGAGNIGGVWAVTSGCVDGPSLGDLDFRAYSSKLLSLPISPSSVMDFTRLIFKGTYILAGMHLHGWK
jgi:hypothetical protein